MKTSRCKLLITAFIVSALLIAGLSIGLAENTGEEQLVLYEGRFTYTLQYPEKTVNVQFVEPYSDMDSGFDLFTVKETEDEVYMSGTLYTDYAYPFWEEEWNYRKLSTDDTWMEQIETSMEKSLGLYLSPDGTKMVEELRLNYPKNLLGFVYPNIVFDMHYPANDRGKWGNLFESMLKTLHFPPQGADISSIELDFFSGDKAGVTYTEIAVDEVEEPFVLQFSHKTGGFVLEQVEWDRDTFTVTKATPLYSADYMSAEDSLKIFADLTVPLPDLRIRWSEPYGIRCFYLTQSRIDKSLHFMDETEVFESLRSHGENYADVCTRAFYEAGYAQAVICRNSDTLRPLIAYNPNSIVAVFRDGGKTLLCGFDDHGGEWKLQWVNDSFLNDGNLPVEIGFYGERFLRIVLPDVKEPCNVVDYRFDADSFNLMSACYLENYISDDFRIEKCMECWKCSVQGNVLYYTVPMDEERINEMLQWEGYSYTDISSSLAETSSIHLPTAVRITDQMIEQPPQMSGLDLLKLGWLENLRIGMGREKAEACSGLRYPDDTITVIYDENRVDCILCFDPDRISGLKAGMTREEVIAVWGAPFESVDEETDTDEDSSIMKGFSLEYNCICPLPMSFSNPSGWASCVFFYFDESDRLVSVELELGM